MIELVDKIVTLLDDKKAIDIQTIEVKEKTTLADYFVVASGTSNTHIKALADHLEYELKKEHILPNKIEGYQSATWILLDYGDVLVHLFTQEEREKYNLEDLWQKAQTLTK